MTELDPNIILQSKPVQIASPFELASGAMTLRNLSLQGQNQQITLEQNQRALQDSKTIADLYRANTNPDGSVNHAGVIQGLANVGLGDKIPAYQQQVATAAKDTTAADSSQFELQQKKLASVNNRIASLLVKPDLTRDDVIDQVNQLTNQHALDPGTRDSMIAAIPQDARLLKDFLVRKGLETQDASKQLEARLSMAPKYNAQDTGAAINEGTVDPLTGQRTAGPTNVVKGVSADTRANISKDYAVAGLNPDGSLKAADASLVDQIGQNRIIPSARLQATPRGQAILSAVEAKYPGYDITTAEAKQTAAKAFTSGKEGAALRSIGTATKHLDALGGMVDALDNGNTTLFNRLGQAFASQTGSTAPTNFDAAKEIVGQEVIKAIVAGGGGVSERAEAAAALDKAKSPPQLKGVIATYKTIMGAQHESLLQQRDAAGLPRSTLPDYTEGATGATATNGTPVPPDIAAILKKHGG